MINALLNLAVRRRGFGYIHKPLPLDTKPLSTLIGAPAALPTSASVRRAEVGPKDQVGSDSCLGMSGAQAFRIASLQRGIVCPDLSGLFPYKLGRASLGIEDQDAGMSYDALLSATRFGFASEETWPFSMIRINARPTGTAFHDAYDRRGVRGYYRIDNDDADGVRHAIWKGIPVIGAWSVDQLFTVNSGPNLIDTPTGNIAGNHAMVIEDYAADGTFGLLNHYGEAWRNSGRCRFTEQYVRSSLGFIAFDVGSSP